MSDEVMQKVKDFIQERLMDKTKPFGASIKKNKLTLFSNKGISPKALSTAMMKKLTKDVNRFSRLLISAQARGDVAKVFRLFRHETRPELTSFSHEDKIMAGAHLGSGHGKGYES